MRFKHVSARLLLAATAMLISVSCGKSVTSDPTDVANVLDPAPEKQPSVQQSSDATIQSTPVDSDEILRDLIDQERDERIKGDEDLQKQIDELEKKLADFRLYVDGEIARLDAKDADLQKQITDNKTAINERVDALETSLNGKIDGAITDLNKKIDDKATEYVEALALAYADLQSKLATLEDKVATDMSALEASITDARNAAIAALQADYDAKIAKLATQEELDAAKQELENAIETVNAELNRTQGELMALSSDYQQFKNEVAQTYATKNELENLNSAVSELERFSIRLSNKVDENDEAVRAMISEEIMALRNDLVSKIDAVDAKADSIRNDLTDHIITYNEKVQSLCNKINTEIAKAKTEIYKFINQSNADLAESFNNRLEAEAVRLEFLTQTVKEELSSKIADLEAEIKAKGDADQELWEALAKAQEEFNRAVAEEQAARAKMQAEMDLMRIQIENLEKQSMSLLAIAESNRAAVERLRNDFDTHKQDVAKSFGLVDAKFDDFETKLAAMDARLTNQIQDVADKATAAVANLGEHVAKQFEDVNTALVTLENKQQAIAAELNTFMEQLLGDEQAQQEFENAVLRPRQDSLAALTDLISGIHELETQFIMTIAPNQDAPEYYNETFKPVMQACGGNPAASFSNALGMDNFQYLAQEFARMLVFGPRMGGTADNIFHGYEAMIQHENLHRLVVLTTLRHTVGSETEDCLSKISDWARTTLLDDSTAKDRVAFLQKISKDANLTRAIEKLKQKLTALADPLKRLEDVIVAHIEGQSEALKKLSKEDVMIEFSIALVEAAHNEFLISEREVFYDKIVSVQNKIAEGDADFKKEFDDKLDDLEKSFQNAIAPLDERITALEAQVGGLTEAMKKALDIIATLADRAGHEDLRQEAIDAGKWIGYTPGTISEFDPKVSEVQHFFSDIVGIDPNRPWKQWMGNTSAKCTGEEIMPGDGGIHTRYQHGGWNECWVNFRNIPSREDWYATVKSLWFRVFGSAHRLKVEVPQSDNFMTYVDYTGMTDGETKMRASTFGGEAVNFPYTLHGSHKDGVFDLSAGDAIESYIRSCPARSGVKLYFTAEKKNGETWVAGEKIGYNIQLFSPIVLDMISTGDMKATNPTVTPVYFDLNNDGVAENTGWVPGDEGGILALDLNGNKVIDNGAELFGQATMLSNGKRADNGYKALAQYDSNGDKVIDQKDEIFSKLIVWFDHNTNGKSEANELKSLRDLGITKLATQYTDTPEEKAFDAAGNNFKYAAKFWGPKQCGEAGCNSHDIFFNTSVSLSVNE